MSKEQSDSDLLPYREVDRALKAKLPLLAGAMSADRPPGQPPVTTQHALGSLLEFWDLCADPRELERIAAEALAAHRTPEVVLPREEVIRKFRLASGENVEPIDLVTLRFLEPRGELFRVRGMSRDFKPILKRLRNREIAALGGKASAAKRLADKGTAQPTGGKGFRGRSAPSSDDAQPKPSPEPKRNRTDNRSGSEPTSEAEPKSSDQRSAISDTSSSYDDDGGPSSPPLAMRFFERFQQDRAAHGWAHEEPPAPDELAAFFADVGTQLGEPTPEGVQASLEVASRGYAKDPYWLERALPWSGFVTQWARHVSAPMLRKGAAGGGRTDAFQAVASRAATVLTAYAITRLGDCQWTARESGFVGTTDDPFFAAYLKEHYGAALAPLGIAFEGAPA